MVALTGAALCVLYRPGCLQANFPVCTAHSRNWMPWHGPLQFWVISTPQGQLLSALNIRPSTCDSQLSGRNESRIQPCCKQASQNGRHRLMVEPPLLRCRKAAVPQHLARYVHVISLAQHHQAALKVAQACCCICMNFEESKL